MGAGSCIGEAATIDYDNPNRGGCGVNITGEGCWGGIRHNWGVKGAVYFVIVNTSTMRSYISMDKEGDVGE